MYRVQQLVSWVWLGGFRLDAVPDHAFDALRLSASAPTRTELADGLEHIAVELQRMAAETRRAEPRVLS